MVRIIQVLKMIEDGEVDQNEGSVIVGKFLKELYIDSALRRADHLDQEHANDGETPIPAPEPKPISWKEYKAMNA